MACAADNRPAYTDRNEGPVALIVRRFFRRRHRSHKARRSAHRGHARRGTPPRRRGHIGHGDTTDDLLTLGGRLTNNPPEREKTSSCPQANASPWRCWPWPSTGVGPAPTPAQAGIGTDSHFGAAQIVTWSPSGVARAVKDDRVASSPVQGISKDDDVTTLDAAARHNRRRPPRKPSTDVCEITDVDGLFFDPRIVPKAPPHPGRNPGNGAHSAKITPPAGRRIRPTIRDPPPRALLVLRRTASSDAPQTPNSRASPCPTPEVPRGETPWKSPSSRHRSRSLGTRSPSPTCPSGAARVFAVVAEVGAASL